VGLRQRRVMHVAPGEAAEHLLRLLVVAITGAGLRREDRNGDDVPHRRYPGHEDLAGVTAGIEQVEFVLLARRNVGPFSGRTAISGAVAVTGTAATGKSNHRRRGSGGPE